MPRIESRVIGAILRKASASFPKNLLEFSARFATEQDCCEYLTDLRWSQGFVCPQCAGTRAWLACTQKTGLSAAGLQRSLGLGSYRTAWLLLQKLRAAMVRLDRERLQGEVEIDETYLGGAEAGVRGRQLARKSLVVVAVELDGDAMGRIRLRHIADASASSLGEFVRDCVEPGSTVHTDGWKGYAGLQRAGYVHRVSLTHADPALTEAEFPHVHLVISLLKRWLLGTHHGSVGSKHLQGYLDEFTFRFNRRKSRHVGKIFYRLAEQLISHEPVTYDELINRSDPSS